MAGEKWFQFVGRIKKQHNFPSLKQAMKYASFHKSEWNKHSGGSSCGAPLVSGGTRRHRRRRHGKRGGNGDSDSGSDSDDEMGETDQKTGPARSDVKEKNELNQTEDAIAASSGGRRKKSRSSRKTRRRKTRRHTRH
jgi:hypothetical protein